MRPKSITIDGQAFTAREIATADRISVSAVHMRLKRGWTGEDFGHGYARRPTIESLRLLLVKAQASVIRLSAQIDQLQRVIDADPDAAENAAWNR